MVLSQLTALFHIKIYSLNIFFLGARKQFWEFHWKKVCFHGRRKYSSVQIAGFCRQDGRDKKIRTYM